MKLALALSLIVGVSADGHIAPGDVSAEACLAALGGTLDRDQLRWAFTSFSLAELNADGWNFEGVPRPDFISATRFWSELCDGSPECDFACPSEQVVIAGPAPGDPIYEEFSAEILTGEGETFRVEGGDILNPYQAFETSEEAAEFIESTPNAISIFDAGFLASDEHITEVPVTDPLPSTGIAFAHPMNAETCMFALGGLSFSQLRWAFTDWTLAQLQEDGWDFTGVPEPDFISPTRYWSELCDSTQPCVDACPDRQVLIAGPAPGTAEFDFFVSKILTGEGELIRQVGGHVEDPYVSGTPEELVEYSKTHADALVIFDFETFLMKSEYFAATPISAEQGGDLITPDWTTIPPGIGFDKGDGSYPLELVVVGAVTPRRTAKRCIATLGGGLTVQQLRWSYTSFALGELVNDGWTFENEVPTPDLVSDTRYWSELCDGTMPCTKACPPAQVLVAGPAEGDIFEAFASLVLPGEGEVYRTLPIEDPYLGTDLETAIATTVESKTTITLFAASDIAEVPNFNLASAVAIKNAFADPEYVFPGADGYILGDIAVASG